MNRWIFGLSVPCLCIAIILGGCKGEKKTSSPAKPGGSSAKAAESSGTGSKEKAMEVKVLGPVSLQEISVIEGLSVPECVLVDPERDVIYIANVDAGEDQYWDLDGKGFISIASPEGKIEELRWLDSSKETPIHGPKGMCLWFGQVCFADITRLVGVQMGAKDLHPTPQIHPQLIGKRLNDLAADDQRMLVSDVETGKIYCVGREGEITELPAPESVNGVTLDGDKCYAVSWKLHDVFEIDLNGKNDPKPFGLADHFGGLDSVEVLEDGTFIVSDFQNNKIFSISPDRKDVKMLAEVETPADMGLDRIRNLLYVPSFMANRVIIYKIVRGPVE